MANYAGILSSPVPQTTRLNRAQVPNRAGGFGYQIDVWSQLDRFLILGTLGGTYYASERDITVENVDAVLECIKLDGPRVVRRLVEVDTAGRAPKKSPAHFVLALCIKHGDDRTRADAYLAVQAVCRTASHLFELVSQIDGLQKGWGRGLRRAVSDWYTSKSLDQVVYQAVNYGTRNGWSHRDLLRLAHINGGANPVYGWLAGKNKLEHSLAQAVEEIKTADAPRAAQLIAYNRIPREAVPTHLLDSPLIWEALAQNMPMTALIRNLNKMTAVGLITPAGKATREICDQLTSFEKLGAARVHPINLLTALSTYRQGHGVKGSLKWDPVGRINAALSEAVMLSFGALPQYERDELIAIDISPSMIGQQLTNFGSLRLHEVAACMALAAAHSNPAAQVVVFDTEWRAIDVSGRRLDDIVTGLGKSMRGGTDLSQPIYAAEKQRGPKPVVIQIYTDDETWAGRMHPEQVWTRYKSAVPSAKCVVASMTASRTTSMPQSEDCLQVVGFDSALPQLIEAFTEGIA